MHLPALTSYGLVQVATFCIRETKFDIDISDPELAAREKCIYAFVVNGEIVRIGSSKGALRVRLKAWHRDVSAALGGRSSSTPPQEAAQWKRLMDEHGGGTIYARQGTQVSTPVGEFAAYMDEESVLIGRYRPKLNRSMHR